jgi:iron complex outermembrane receptor protein
VGYVDAEITKSNATFDDVAGNVIPYAGSRIPYAPRWSADEYVRYERHVSNDLVAGVQMDYDYRSTLATPRGVINGAIGKIPGYGLLGARIDLHQISGQWTFALFGNNITNERYITTEGSDGAGSQSEVFAPPASYGVRISKKF